MALSVTDVSELQSYIRGVMDRAAHHAGNVDQIALTLAGAIIWRKDDDPIKVMTRDGDTKNVLWVHINGTRYAFSYNHQSGGQIEMRKGNTQGAVLHAFSNTTPVADVKRIFETL